MTQPSLSNALRDVSASRRALAGFFLSGLVLSFPGAILPAWGYHLRPHFVTVGTYFLAVLAGVLLAVLVSRRALNRSGAAGTLVLACIAICCSFAALAGTAPPVGELWRVPGLIGLGFGAGLVNTAVFHAISPVYRANPPATVNLAGIFFGLGSFVTPVLIAGTFNIYGVPAILLLLAVIPGCFAAAYRKLGIAAVEVSPQPGVKQVIREFRVPSAVLLSLLLFFHFGNEWAIAGWLPLFLILRLGMSPAAALVMLAVYWLALMGGRIGVQALLPRVSHPKLLFFSVLASLFGCIVLTMTDNRFGAWLGTLLIGFGFAPIYPLAVGAIGARFPHYHPGFFNGIFSIALTGGMLAPATLGYLSEYFGIQTVTMLPAAGTFIVLLLVLVIWADSRIAAWSSPQPESNRIS